MTKDAMRREKRPAAPTTSRATASHNAGLALRDRLGNRGLVRLLAKRRVDSPGSRCERSADAAADRALSGGAPASIAPDSCSCAPCQAQTEMAGGAAPADSGHNVRPAGHGAPLTESFRAFLESRFATDFADVRVHTDPVSAASADAIGARAYTMGNDIVFAPGEHDPRSPRGLRLLAHELAHVVQARGRHDEDEPVVQRQPTGEERKDAPVTVPVNLEYEAYDPFAEKQQQPSIFPAMGTGGTQSLGYWTHPPGSAFSDYFIPAWARKRSFLEPLGQQPGGDWLLERYAGRSSFDPTSPATSSRVKEVFGFGLRTELYPRSFIPAEQGIIAGYLDRRAREAGRAGVTRSDIAQIPDILRRVNSGGRYSYTADELDLLHRAARAHAESHVTGGSPFLSTTSRPGLSTEFAATKKGFLSGRPYVVRVRVPNSAVLETNLMPDRPPTLIPEQEMLVTTDLRGRIVAVQPNPTSSLAKFEPYMRWGGRGLLAFGLGMSGYRIATASEEDRPIVIMQEFASHTGALAGGGLTASGCVATGLATGGVVLFACGLVGAVLGAEAAERLVTLPFQMAEGLAYGIPQAAQMTAPFFEGMGQVASVLPELMAGGPLRAHGMMDPGNWDLRYFPPAMAPDVAAVGIAMWERLGALPVDEFVNAVNKPVGTFGVPMASARRIAAFLSSPDQQYNADLPALYASIGPTLPAVPKSPGINILEMKPLELMELLSARKLNFVQDPYFMGGWAGRLQKQPMEELSLRLLIEKRERIAEDNWSFPGKVHEQVRALRYVGQTAWNKLKVMDENELRKYVDRPLSSFGVTDFAFRDAAGRLNELSAAGTPLSELSETERAEEAAQVAEVAQGLATTTPEDYANWLVRSAGLVYLKDPTTESYAAINRVKNGLQPW